MLPARRTRIITIRHFVPPHFATRLRCEIRRARPCGLHLGVLAKPSWPLAPRKTNFPVGFGLDARQSSKAGRRLPLYLRPPSPPTGYPQATTSTRKPIPLLMGLWRNSVLSCPLLTHAKGFLGFASRCHGILQSLKSGPELPMLASSDASFENPASRAQERRGELVLSF